MITIECGGFGGIFDAIVFGERQHLKWIAGSDYFHRTQDFVGPLESAKSTDLIHLAVVYDAGGGIMFYREGQPYGERYIPRGTKSTLQTYPAGESHILLGQRCTGVTNGSLIGAIEEARLYDRALRADEVAASYRAGVSRQTSGAPAGEGGDKDRRAAAAVLRLGGTVVIRVAEDEEEIKPSNGLPAATFRLVRVRLDNRPELVDADLEPLRGLTNIVEISLSGSKDITDAGIACLQGLTSLRRIELGGTQLTNAGLVALRSLRRLSGSIWEGGA